jgi:thioredoxin reductase
MWDVAIVGNGPAVYMAAIYTHTANISTLIVNEIPCLVPAFAGYDKVVGVMNVHSPEELIDLMQQQVANFGIQRICAAVAQITLQGLTTVHTDHGVFVVKCVIIDSITLAQKIFGEGADVEQLAENGVFVCGYMDGVPNEAIVLIGSGCQAAFNVKDFVSK